MRDWSHRSLLEIYPDREFALQSIATHDQYDHLPAGMRQVTAKELCTSAARIERFDTLTSHLSALGFCPQVSS